MNNISISPEDRAQMNDITQKAIEQGYDNAVEAWKAMALDCLKVVCQKKQTFTVNDVRDLVNLSPIKTHDNRAMGGVIAAGRSLGWLERTGQSIPSIVGHRTHIQVWRSLIFRKT